MDEGLKSFLVGFSLFALFLLLIVTSIVTVGNEYGRNDTATIFGSAVDVVAINNTVNSISTQANQTSTTFQQQGFWASVGGIITNLAGIFSVAKNMWAIITLPFTFLSGIMVGILHIPSFVANIINAMLTFSIIFAVWRWIRVGW